jgi:hypothetical protein
MSKKIKLLKNESIKSNKYRDTWSSVHKKDIDTESDDDIDDGYERKEKKLTNMEAIALKNYIHATIDTLKPKEKIYENPCATIQQPHEHPLVEYPKEINMNNSPFHLVKPYLLEELMKNTFYTSTELYISQKEMAFTSINDDEDTNLLSEIGSFETAINTRCKTVQYDKKKDIINCLFVLDNEGIFFVLLVFDCLKNMPFISELKEQTNWISQTIKEEDWKLIQNCHVKYKGYVYINCTCFT